MATRDTRDSNDPDLYKILGVEKTATQDQIKKAYRSLARKLHPDANQNDPDAAKKFQDLGEAYSILGDPEKRELFDKFGYEAAKQGRPPMNGFFPFGQPEKPTRTQDVRHGLPVTLEQLYNGATRRLRITRKRRCGDCKGTGSTDPSKVEKCETCDGIGIVMMMRQLGPGFVQQMRRPCPDCRGEGETIDANYSCKTCNGKKLVDEKKELEVMIHKGMKNGQRITFEGEADESPDLAAGDIIFILQEQPHKSFMREGLNLIHKKKISLSQALTGLEFVLEHLDGRKIKVATKPGEVISPGQMKQISGEGMPKYRDPFNKGHLRILFEIEFPKKLPVDFQQKLAALLPPKPKTEEIKEEFETRELEEVTEDKDDHHRREAYHEDDDEEEHQGIQCGTQ